MTTLYRPLIDKDIPFIIEHMRKADEDECNAMGMDKETAVNMTVRSNSIEACTLLNPVTLEPAGLLGVNHSPLHKRLGIIWMFGTDDIKKFKFTFIKHCKPRLDELFTVTDKDGLYNYCFEENEVHLEWIRWMGFTTLRKVSLLPFHKSFVEFIKLRKDSFLVDP